MVVGGAILQLTLARGKGKASPRAASPERLEESKSLKQKSATSVSTLPFMGAKGKFATCASNSHS